VEHRHDSPETAARNHVAHARSPRGASHEPERVTDPDRLAAHLADAAHVPGGYAAALVEPRTEGDVARAVAAAEQVLVVGAQSSLTGGATPRGETLLSTVRMRELTDLPNGALRVSAGITIAEIDAHLRRRGAVYPPLPTWQGATIGGAVATNAAGASTFKHGTTRAWVDGLTVVLASGLVLDLRRGETTAHPDGYFELESASGRTRVPVPHYRLPDVPKVSAGYFAAPGMDLVDLFIGSEGTLAIVTDVTLRVLASRPAVCLAFVTFGDRAAALAFVARAREESQRAWQARDGTGIDVSAIEHMDARSLALLREDGVDRRLGVKISAESAMGLLVALDLPAGTTSSDAYEAFGRALDADGPAVPLARLAALLQEFDADDALIAAPGDAAAHERLLALREAVPLAVNQRVGRAQRDIDPRIEKTAADVVVPFERFGEMLALYEAELKARCLDGAIWGHISDGNVHPNVIPRSFSDVESGRAAVLAFGRAAIRLGGSPLAEHGVGRNATKQQLLHDLYGESGISDMRAVKAALDPDGKLAPGVIFPAR